MRCNLCPRECGVDREETIGFCGASADFEISLCSLHMWEEPCISGKSGSGAVFFSGCSLKCAFCQNYMINGGGGRKISVSELSDKLLELQDSGAHNISLVTAAHYADKLPILLDLAIKKGLKLPVVYNSSGYEKVDTLKALEGYIDVYLPDFKFFSPRLSKLIANAPDYAEVAAASIGEMLRQQPNRIYKQGLLVKGVLIRHLVLPCCLDDSRRVLDFIADKFGKQTAVSLMSQYFPPKEFCGDLKFLSRSLTKNETRRISDYFYMSGFADGYVQSIKSAVKDYVPKWEDFND